jgi:8-oxo-dGTP pyrophosphatase MutT (NUDIX family)
VAFRKLNEVELHRGHVISLATVTYEDPDGGTFDREVVHHPGAVSVVPVTDDGLVVMVRQFRVAIDAEALEIPAGKRDVPGEDPEVTAQRELGEEVGLHADRLELLARFHNSIGFSDELSHVYLGTGLTEVPLDLQGVEEQHMAIERVPLDDLLGLIARGELTDAKSIIGLTLARERLASR